MLKCLKLCLDPGRTGEPSCNDDTAEDDVDGVLIDGVFALFLEKSSVHRLGDEVLEPDVGVVIVSFLEETGVDPTFVSWKRISWEFILGPNN